MPEAAFQCAGCGQWNEIIVDESAGKHQSYVEDCQICCKPNVLDVRWSPAERAFVVHAELES